MSGAFRKRKTEKTKSALNLFHAFFLSQTQRNERNNSFKQIIINNRRAGYIDLSSKILTKCLG
jgi:hypothetical protein